MRLRTVTIIICTLPGLADGQWSAAVNLSNSPGLYSVDGSMDLDGSGKVHIAYDDWVGSTHNLYYVENTSGVWSSPQHISSARNPILRITPDQVVHVFYKINSAIWEVTKPIGTAGWSSPVKVSHDGQGDRWPIGATTDASGGLYFAYLHLWNDVTSTPSATWGRYKPLGGSWGDVELIENGTDRDHWPTATEIVANGSNIYAAWDINPGSGAVSKYKKRQGGAWGSARSLDSSGGAARLAFAPNGEMAAAWSKDTKIGSQWFEVFAKFSNDDGATWTSPFNVSDAHSGLDRTPEITYDAASTFHLVYQRYECDGCEPDYWYRTRPTGGTWDPKYNLTNTPGRTGAALQCIRAYGTGLHFVFIDNSAGSMEDVYYMTTVSAPPPDRATVQGYVANAYGHPISGVAVTTAPGNFAGITNINGQFTISGLPVGTYSVSATKAFHTSATISGVAVQQNQTVQINLSINGIAPESVTGFVVAPENTSNLLSWTNPNSDNSSGTLVVFKTTGYPTSLSDGTVIADLPAPAGMTSTFTHTGLVNGQPFYYRAFAYFADTDHYYAAGVNATGTPAGPGDYDSDGDVDQVDFGIFQTCLSGPYVPQAQPRCTKMRLDADNDVDLDDTNLFVGCISGPNTPANPACVP